MAKRIKAGLADADVRALAEGRHGDPFAVLGPQGDVLRVILPQVARLWLVQGRAKPVEMARHPAAGEVFEGPLKPDKPYTLRAEAEDGTVWDFDDPYRFGPVLGEMDEYLIGEGNHRRLWTKLGAHPMTHEGAGGVHFAVWAPNAERVSVVGDFNA